MAETEQQDEQSVDVEVVEQEPGQVDADNSEDNEATENEIVLAGQEDADSKPDPKSDTDHILNRVMRKKDKLKDENVQLRQQLEAVARPAPQALQSAPDEYADEYADDRPKYLAAKAAHDRQMLTDVVGQQINRQQNGHRLQAQEQRRSDSLKTYAETASKLKVSDFNETQDRAFDVLGDDIAQMIAEQLPSDAPKLLYYLGKNPTRAEQLREQFASNPGGVTFELGKLAGNLTIQPKRTKAAEPESKSQGSGVAGVNGNWQKQLDKIDVDFSSMSKNFAARREIKKQAKAAGYDVSTLK